MRSPTFFSLTTASKDPIYRFTPASQGEPYAGARQFIEQIYRETHSFLDPDLAKRAPTIGLASVFAEMYFAHTLNRRGLKIVARGRRIPKLRGPDLLAENPDVWIEVVCPTGGEGPDRLRTPEPRTVYTVPDREYLLRLRSSFGDKAAKMQDYIRRGDIRIGQAAVIGISGALLEFRFQELPIPRIVSALLAVGPPIIELDRLTGSTVGHSFKYRDKVPKAGGIPIRTDPFLSAEYAHISAVLYTPSCWVCRPHVPGEDFIVVHNPFAQTPLPDGWLSAGQEYWLDDDHLRCKHHPRRRITEPNLESI